MADGETCIAEILDGLSEIRRAQLQGIARAKGVTETDALVDIVRNQLEICGYLFLEHKGLH